MPPPAWFAGFGAFAEHNAAVRSCLRTAADGVWYVELTFTAAAHGARLGAGDLPLEGVLAGLRAGRRDAGVAVRLVLDHSRRRPVPWAAETVRLATAHPEVVVGFGVAGDEAAPLAPYAPVVAVAAEAGLHLVHHAGETAGAASVREALGIGRAERIGHGFRSLEDPELVAELRDRRVSLEVCPSSNVALGLVPSLPEHPLPALVDAGLVVTLNTDIPSVTGRSLSAEYAAVRSTFGASDAELAGFAAAAVDAGYAPDDLKNELRAATAAWLAS